MAELTTNQIHIGYPPSSKYAMSSNKAQSVVDSPFLSAAVDLQTAATTSVFDVPPGAYVHQVLLLCSGTAVSGADIDVGDSGTTDRFIDGVTDMAKNDMVGSGLGGAVNADPVQGRYYPNGGIIQVKVNGTVSAGTVKVLVFWTFPTT